MSCRWSAITLGLTLGLTLSGLAACSDDAGAGPGAGASSGASAKAAINPDVVVRFPRYWATTDQAESGAEAASNTRFFIGVDGKRLVYTGQDVIRLIDRDSGKQIKQTLIGDNQVICAFPPDRKVDDHILIVGTGSSGTAGDDGCQTVRGYDLEKGRFLWSHRLPDPGEINLDTRDDSVLLTTKVQSPRDYQIGYGLSVLDLHTGRTRWSTTPPKAYSDSPDPDLSNCTVRAGLAAAKPIVVALAACSDFTSGGGTVPRAVGYDLASGKKRWTRSADWLTSTTASADSVSYESVLPHPNDAAFFPATRQTDAGYVDPETGKGRAVPTPEVAQYAGSEDNSYVACSDFGENGNSFPDACVFPAADGTLLYVNSLSGDKGGRLRMEGVEEKTGKRRFLVDLKKPKAKAGDYVPAFTFLGLDDRRAEFWLSTDDVEVDRYSVSTGKRTGRGQLAPPLGLTQIAAMGPGYLAVRNAGGITGPTRNVLSGVDYYRTNTTR